MKRKRVSAIASPGVGNSSKETADPVSYGLEIKVMVIRWLVRETAFGFGPPVPAYSRRCNGSSVVTVTCQLRKKSERSGDV